MNTIYTAKGDSQGNVLLSYKVYKALLTQSVTDDPVEVVLQNTLGGDVTWTYNGPGSYIGSTLGLLNNKTIFFSSQTLTLSEGDNIYTYVEDINDVSITTTTWTGTDFVATNGMLLKTYVEIQVYPE